MATVCIIGIKSICVFLVLTSVPVVCYGQESSETKTGSNRDSQCLLQTSSNEQIRYLEELWTTGDRIIKLEFNSNVTFSSEMDKDISMSAQWMMVKNKGSFQAYALLSRLLLKPLWVLGLQSRNVIFELEASSPYCTFNSSTYHRKMQTFISKNLTRSLDRHFICSAEQSKEQSILTCCSISEKSEMECVIQDELYGGDSLRLFLFLIKLFMVLFVAGFIPKRLYETRNGYREYVHVLKLPLELEVSKTSHPPREVLRADDNLLKTKSSPYIKRNRYLHQEEVEKLSNLVDDIDVGTTHTFKLHAVWIKVHQCRLLSENSVPVKLLNFLQRRLLQCKCYMQGIKRKRRKDKDAEADINHISLHDCCSQRICFNNTWQTFSRECVRVVGFVVLSLFPGLVYIYVGGTRFSSVKYEHDSPSYHEFLFLTHFKRANALSLYSLCYAIWFIPFVLYSWMSLLTNPMFKIKTVSVLRKTMRAMKNPAGIGWSWSMSFLLRPFSKKLFSDVSAVTSLFSIVWRFCCVFIAGLIIIFYNIPTINLYFRLLLTFAYQLYLCICNKPETNGADSSVLLKDKMYLTKKNIKSSFNLPESDKEIDQGDEFQIVLLHKYERIQWGILCAIWLIYLIFAIFPFVDIIIVITDLVLNIFVGLFVGVRQTILLVLTAFFLLFYRHTFFQRIEMMFQKFSRQLQQHLKDQYTKALLNKIASNADGLHGNTAIQVLPKSGGCKRCALNYTLSSKRGVPKLESKYLIQFFDKYTNTHISRSFFFESCYMRHFACPGSVSHHVYKAARNFLTTAVFLVSLMAILLLFAEEVMMGLILNALAMFVGGLFPFILYTYVFGNTNDDEFPVINPNDEGFRFCLENLLREFTQKWTITDFEISRKPVVTGNIKVSPRKMELTNKGECWFSTHNRQYLHVELLGSPHGEYRPILIQSLCYDF